MIRNHPRPQWAGPERGLSAARGRTGEGLGVLFAQSGPKGAPVKTGEVKWMQEPYGEGLATRTGPRSCADIREGAGEAWIGVPAGWVLSRENAFDRGADAILRSGRPHPSSRSGKRRRDPARSKTPGMPGITSHGNREILRSTEAEGASARTGKPKGARR